MGSSSRMDRIDRFIQEFNGDACKRYSFNEFACFKQQNLGEYQDNVYMFVMIENRGRQEELMLPMILFDPEEPKEMLVDRICDVLSLTEEGAIERLKKANLY